MKKSTKPGNRLLTLKREYPYVVLLIPAFIMYAVFCVYPTVSSLRFSLTNWNGYSPDMDFIALGNFEYMLQDASFGTAIRNTFIFVFMDVIIQNVLGLATALLLESRIRSRNVLRGLFFIPVVLSGLVVSYLWTYIYGYNGGVLNVFLERLGMAKIDFIGDGKIAIYFVVVAGIWQWVMYRTVIYISGLQSIPAEMLEAASLDGATRWQRFRYVTIPLLQPAFKINVLLCTINALKQFDIVYIMTKGGPGTSTHVFATKMYAEAFTHSDFGYGCAIGVVLFLFILVITLIINKLFDDKEVEM